MDDQNKNLILATALSFLVILVWFLLFPPPEQQPPQTETPAAATDTNLPDNVAPTPPAAVTTAETSPQSQTPLREATLSEARRVRIETPRLTGSISLLGGRIDDLSLKDYRETIEPDSDIVTLLTPVGQPEAYYTLFGWAPGGDLAYEDVPGANTEWQIEGNDTLTPQSPVILVWDNGKGLIFRRKIEVDSDYLFTITQTVENLSGKPVRLAPYGMVARHGEPSGQKRFFILHEGVIRMSDGELEEIKYGKLPDMPFNEREGARTEIIDVQNSGWTGFTDHYWMTTLMPFEGQPFTSVAKYVEGSDILLVEARQPAMTVEPGQTAQASVRMFSGAKEWETIRRYQNEAGIDRFIDSIDWGWFFFLTKPIFAVLHWLNGMIGNMGWAIIGLTLIIKALVFPLAYKSYVSMAKMKELQPRIEELKKKAGDDRQKLQQGMMELYKKEKVNPAAGCLPILLQIPIFFSLYKVIFVTLELRQAPWIGWIRDLSAPDPSSILNLFGLLPYSPPDPSSIFYIFSLGVLPILLGISMWLQQKLNPAPTDPTQAMIFAWMPWVFMFMLGQFASGLVLYWIANNTITFIQQYAIMRLHGHKPDVFGNIISSFKRKKKEPKAK